MTSFLFRRCSAWLRTTFSGRTRGERTAHLQLVELEDRIVPSTCDLAGSLLESLTTCRNWITYSPSRPFNPDQNVFPTEAEIRTNLQQLFDEGWRGLVTYSMDGTLREVPRIAKEVGFSRVIAGLFWFDDAQLAREKVAAVEEVGFVDGYVVGNEGLLFNRYSRAALESEISMLQAATGKPVTTTETNGQYFSDPTLLGVGDWVFPTSQTWFAPLAIRDPTEAVTEVANSFEGLEKLAPDRTIVLKESWWPTDGQLYSEPSATEANQVEFFRQLAGSDVFFVWGEAYDSFWKSAEGPQGPHWGYHTDTGVPKEIVSALNPVYTQAYTFQGGVHVATGDVNGDGTEDIITGAGAGGSPHVQVFDGKTGVMLASFFAYDAGFAGGVSVASGDIDNDGFADIITGAGAGGGPHVRVFSGGGAGTLADFFAYDSSFLGGINLASGDLNGDGIDDIVVGAGPGGGPHVRVFGGGGAGLLADFFAYDAGFTGGVSVSTGNLDNDGFIDIITGAGAGGGPHVRAFSGGGAGLLADFFAYDGGFLGGINIASADLNGDGRDDILTGAGAGDGPHVRAFGGGGEGTLADFFAYDGAFLGGVFVAAADLNADGKADFVIGNGSGGRHLRLFDGADTSLTDEFFAYPRVS